MILFFDSETTGKADFRADADAPHQPRLVQLAAILADDNGIELASLSVIIKPVGYEIPPESTAIHGISHDLATRAGVGEITATHMFDQLLIQSTVAAAHNFDFDKLILSRGSQIRAKRLAQSNYCTMHAMTPICRLPGRYGDYKWPKLQEAYRFAFGKEFDGAHNALADVRACKEIYFWLMANKQPYQPEPAAMEIAAKH
jgi:DNA polymerase-3 subunit epsilon